MKTKFLLFLIFIFVCNMFGYATPSSITNLEDKLLRYAMKNVVSKKDLSALMKMRLSEREEWLKEFWKGKDPTPTTEQNEFRDEFQRRVNYALENFGTKTGDKLWDERGDVYIIYGEPDEKEMGVYKTWRTNYENANQSETQPPPEDMDIFRGSDDESHKGGKSPKSDRRIGHSPGTNRQAPDEEQTVSGAPYDNFHMSYGEIWHYYTQQMIFQFEDQKSTGFYSLVPYTDPFGRTQSMQELSKLKIGKIENQEMLYKYDYQGKPFDYALDLLRFKGNGATYNLDIDLGFPLKDMGLGGPDSDQVEVMRRASILDDKLNTLFSDSATLRKKVDKAKLRDQLIIDQLVCVLNPGEYTLAMEVRDLVTQKVGVYKKEFIIPKYVTPGSQEISPVIMASLIRPAYLGETKFAKHGYVVVPMPSRVYYSDQPIYLYYEVYGLKQDDQGKVRYTINYSLVDYVKKKEVAFYEPKTFEADSTNLFHTAKLDASAIPPGEYALAVRITDINRGKDKVTLTSFKIAKK